MGGVSPWTTGHLCTGYDGLGMALDIALPDGHEPRWHAEYDAAASRLLARTHPGVPNARDITAAPWELAPAVDLVTAGFPCQPVSAAGFGLADADPRWLWPWVMHVIRTLCATRPPAVFLENVERIVSIQGGVILRGILTDLQSAGYRSRWTVVGACAVGAPHHRHRWFLVAAYVGPGAPPAERVGVKALCGAPRSGGRALLPSPMARDGDGRGEGDVEYWRRRVATGRTNGIPFGAAVNLLPSPRGTDGSRGGEPNRGDRTGTGGTLTDAVVSLLPTPRATDVGTPGRRSSEGWRPQLGQAIGLLPGIVARPQQWGKYAEAVALWETVTGRAAPGPTEPAPQGGVRLHRSLPEWMMGLPAGLLTEGASRGEALKLAGNGVVPRQAAAAWRLLTGRQT